MSTPVTTTSKAKTAAKNTLLQGLLAALAVGVGTGLLQALSNGHFALADLGTSVATAAVASVLAYVQHAYAAPYLAIRKSAKSK